MSKAKSQSGLATLKRDWSVASSNPPKSSQEIDWPPTPPKQPTPSQTELSGKEKRLRDIQNALSNRSTPVISQPFAKPLTKRPSDTEFPDTSHEAPLTKKPRQLPPGYRDDDPLTRATDFSSGSRVSKVKSTYTPAPPETKKVSPVFLSQEQNQILKLVQDGNSVFYTGSAGE
ncbi:hypothetical protein B0H10DRAFT_1066191 [Mycena sp. CBHHK59/15]|nr:hypothetical protein B0H10DRAFT_1066191 [Mycena sp. CBHHK59/15]